MGSNLFAPAEPSDPNSTTFDKILRHMKDYYSSVKKHSLAVEKRIKTEEDLKEGDALSRGLSVGVDQVMRNHNKQKTLRTHSPFRHVKSIYSNLKKGNSLTIY